LTNAVKKVYKQRTKGTNKTTLKEENWIMKVVEVPRAKKKKQPYMGNASLAKLQAINKVLVS
jgi:hypothetical protein